METTGNKVRNCKICQKPFMPKTKEGFKARYKTCSPACANLATANAKIKYTAEEIQKVIDLKKQSIPNHKISEITNVKLWKVKEIINENKLFLTKEQSQKNAYSGKLKNNPNSMELMRNTYHEMIKSDENLDNTKKILLERGYEYIEGFQGKSKPFKIKCLKCKKIRTTRKINTVIKNSCMYCSGSDRTSKAEKEIEEWIFSLGIVTSKYKFKNRKHGIEIDVFAKDLMIGIEYCGLYWHNENSPTPRDKTYHFNKMKKANNDNIRLITIFEDEWKNRNKQVKNFLKSILNYYSNKIFARKCECKIITKEMANTFIEENHIQGSGKTQLSIGLFYSNELVGVITGGQHHRDSDSSVLVLNRLAFKDGWQVTGGASKLFNFFKNEAFKNGYSKIISWSDNRWSEGNVYKKIGFTLEQELSPDYSYVFGQKRIPKQSLQKKDLIKLGAQGLTELEMSKFLGYNRIWDCGKKRWIFNLTS